MDIYPNGREDSNNFMCEIIDMHIERTITDEMAQRVLAPVLERIRAGEFDEPLRKAKLTTAKKQLQEAASYWHILIIEN